MASKPDRELLERVRLAIETPKLWVAGPEIGWVSNGKKPPPGYKFTAPLAYASDPSVRPANLFVAGYFKESQFEGVAPKLSLGFIFEENRVLGVDDGPPSQHLNEVGVNEKYYQLKVGHPQLHRVVDDALYGYAEPLPTMPASQLWMWFFEHARIQDAPNFKLPVGQLEMPL